MNSECVRCRSTWKSCMCLQVTLMLLRMVVHHAVRPALRMSPKKSSVCGNLASCQPCLRVSLCFLSSVLHPKMYVCGIAQGAMLACMAWMPSTDDTVTATDYGVMVGETQQKCLQPFSLPPTCCWQM